MIEDRVSSVVCHTFVSQIFAVLTIAGLIKITLDLKSNHQGDIPIVVYAIFGTYMLLWLIQGIFAHQARAAARQMNMDSIPALRRFRRMSIFMGILHLPGILLAILLFVAASKSGKLVTGIKYSSSGQYNQKVVAMGQVV